MGDLISRQDAIEAIEEIAWYHQNRNREMVSGANSTEDQAWYKSQDIYAALEALPSAEAVHKPDYSYEAGMVRRLKEALSAKATTGDYPNDLISRSALMKYCSNQKSKSIDNNDIARFPSAEAVEGWIPLSHDDNGLGTDFPYERDGEWVIVTDGKSISVERIKKDAYDHFFPNGRWFGLEDVIAWMPMPEPYKEDNDG